MTAVRRTVPVEERWGERWVQPRAEGMAPSAGANRLLSRWAGAWAVRAAGALRTEVFGESLEAAGAARVPHAVAGFALLRFTQNALIFLLAGLYYRKLGFSFGAVLLGLSLLGWAFTQNHWDTHFAVSVYMDLILTLSVALLIVGGREPWVLLVVGLGALNRETALVLPLLVLAAGLTWRPHVRCTGRHAIVAGIGFGTYALVSLWLWSHYGQPPFKTTAGRAITAALLENLARPEFWLQVCAVVGILPFVAARAGAHLPAFVRRTWWAASVPWGLVFLCSPAPTQAALLYVPLALALVPAVLASLEKPQSPIEGIRP